MDCDTAPDQLDNPERPCAAREPVAAGQGASDSERQDEPAVPALKGVHRHHEGEDGHSVDRQHGCSLRSSGLRVDERSRRSSDHMRSSLAPLRISVTSRSEPGTPRRSRADYGLASVGDGHPRPLFVSERALARTVDTWCSELLAPDHRGLLPAADGQGHGQRRPPRALRARRSDGHDEGFHRENGRPSTERPNLRVTYRPPSEKLTWAVALTGGVGQAIVSEEGHTGNLRPFLPTDRMLANGAPVAGSGALRALLSLDNRPRPVGELNHAESCGS
jgi:hypothetical protein